MPSTNLKPLSKKLLSENVVGAIRTAIYDGELELGQRLVETELAEQLGVSRGPIREALRLLANEGLVVINVHRGTFVLKPTVSDVEEIYTLREALESLALRRVVAVAADQEIEALEGVAEQMVTASRQKKATQVVGLNMDFHAQVFQLARHKRLSQAWASLESQIRLFNQISIEWTQKIVARAVEDHSKIVKALKKRDAVAACKIMSEHVKAATDNVLQSMEQAKG